MMKRNDLCAVAFAAFTCAVMPTIGAAITLSPVTLDCDSGFGGSTSGAGSVVRTFTRDDCATDAGWVFGVSGAIGAEFSIQSGANTVTGTFLEPVRYVISLAELEDTFTASVTGLAGARAGMHVMNVRFLPVVDHEFVSFDDPIAPVPLPAGLPLLLAGLAGLAGLRRIASQQ